MEINGIQEQHAVGKLILRNGRISVTKGLQWIRILHKAVVLNLFLRYRPPKVKNLRYEELLKR
jgi:hypothetical protein